MKCCFFGGGSEVRNPTCQPGENVKQTRLNIYVLYGAHVVAAVAAAAAVCVGVSLTQTYTSSIWPAYVLVGSGSSWKWIKQPRVVDGFILKTAVKEHRSLPNSCFHVS